MKIKVTRYFAEMALLSGDTTREVFRRKLSTNSRWVAIHKPSDIVDGCEYAVSAYVDKSVATEMLRLNTEVKAKQAELDELKQKLIGDAIAYRSMRPRNTYTVRVGESQVSVTQSNRADIVAANALKSKLGEAFNDVFIVKPTAYELPDGVKEAVMAAVDGDVLQCSPMDYLSNIASDAETLHSMMTKSVKQNAVILRQELGVDWDTAMEWACDYNSCKQYELLNMLATAVNMSYNEFVTTLSAAVSVSTSNRVNITNKE